MIRILIVLCALAAFGCSSTGFNRGELSKQIGVVHPAQTDEDIAKILKKKPNLPKPFKLAVYFRKPITKPLPYTTELDWRWSEDDQKTLLANLDTSENKKLISEVFPILPSLVTSEDIHEIRAVAAQHGADALLIIGGTVAVDRYINNWGWSYIALVPMLFVPGTEVDVLTMTNASLWDVRNEYLYLTAESEGLVHDKYIAAFGRRDVDLINESKTKALQKLNDAIKNQLDGKK